MRDDRGCRRFRPARLSMSPVSVCVRLSIRVRAMFVAELPRHQERDSFGNNTQARGKPAGELAVDLHVDAGVRGSVQGYVVRLKHGDATHARQPSRDYAEQVLHIWDRVGTFKQHQLESTTEERCA